MTDTQTDQEQPVPLPQAQVGQLVTYDELLTAVLNSNRLGLTGKFYVYGTDGHACDLPTSSYLLADRGRMLYRRVE